MALKHKMLEFPRTLKIGQLIEAANGKRYVQYFIIDIIVPYDKSYQKIIYMVRNSGVHRYVMYQTNDGQYSAIVKDPSKREPHLR